MVEQIVHLQQLLGHFYPQPSSGNQPTAVNASNTTDTALGPKRYYVTWDILEMDSTPTWLQIRVRCQYKDKEFDSYKMEQQYLHIDIEIFNQERKTDRNRRE